MKHSFRLKKAALKSVFSSKLGINSLSIENNFDVQNSINTILSFIELEDCLNPVRCSYNFLNTQVSFELELNPLKSKKDFFEAIKAFETFIEV